MISIQKSFARENENGCIYLVPTPIGNLEDMTFRAIRILKEVDLIGAEDTRNTRKLLNYFEIETQLISYHEHNKLNRGKQLLNKVKEGMTIALVSDAGMPIISDPGFELVKDAIDEGIAVIPLPGANAALTSLVASGLAPQPFYFYGFLQRKKKDKLEELQLLKYLQATIILYESPHRLKETLTLMLQVLGERQISLSRELTKKYEEFVRGPISSVVEFISETEIRGEFCIIIEGSTEQIVADVQWWEQYSIIEHVNYYIEEKGFSPRDAIKITAEDRKIKRKDVYQTYHS